ncbi:MAG: hypothetical protein QXL94_07840 [Candidatus Parvarchaeum sp.]
MSSNASSLARKNGASIEDKIIKFLNLIREDEEGWDAYDPNTYEYYEIKSCQSINVHGDGKRSGRFKFKSKDFKNLNKTFIFVVHTNLEIEKIFFIRGENLFKYVLKRKDYSWRVLYNHAEKVIKYDNNTI